MAAGTARTYACAHIHACLHTHTHAHMHTRAHAHVARLQTLHSQLQQHRSSKQAEVDKLKADYDALYEQLKPV